MKRAWRGPSLCPAQGATAPRAWGHRGSKQALLIGDQSSTRLGMVWCIRLRRWLRRTRVERSYLQILRGGHEGRDSPLFGFSADAMTAFNPRRVDRWVVPRRESEVSLMVSRDTCLHEMVGGLGVEVFPNGLTKAQCLKEGHGLRGCNGDAQRVPLPSGVVLPPPSCGKRATTQ